MGNLKIGLPKVGHEVDGQKIRPARVVSFDHQLHVLKEKGVVGPCWEKLKPKGPKENALKDPE